MTPLFLGLGGPAPSADERDLFRAADPGGFILFKLNGGESGQFRPLTHQMRALSWRCRTDASIPSRKPCSTEISET